MFGPDQGFYPVERGPDLVRLQRNEDVILRTKLVRTIGRARVDGEACVRSDDAQPTVPDGRELRTTANDADLNAGHTRQMSADIAADRTGTEDANLHGAVWCVTAARPLNAVRSG